MSDPRFRFVKGDIADRDAVYKIFEQELPDVVVNFAAESHVDRSIENSDCSCVLTSSEQECSSTPAGRSGVKRYHQVSTDEVYGSRQLTRPRPVFTEETPLHTSSPYSASKVGTDLLVLSYHRTFRLPGVIDFSVLSLTGRIIFLEN